ncbi:CLUMA_CG009452, isoform A [Clunio marinus]|uniref:CLUMA_CG009452, isoform A n=1 Tax=Clunio marinus TaxID=568069 RepID=A0A1J1I8W8_9DIPT|nr:CLUMA_CG009452, isoform A [Clunio marinus]
MIAGEWRQSNERKSLIRLRLVSLITKVLFPEFKLQSTLRYKIHQQHLNEKFAAEAKSSPKKRNVTK